VSENGKRRGWFGFGSRGESKSPDNDATPEANLDEPTEDEIVPQAEQATAPAETEPENLPAPIDEPVPEKPEPEKKGFFSRLKQGLSRSTNAMSDGITGIFTKAKLDADTLQDLEDLLITSDLGVDTAAEVAKRLGDGRYDKEVSPDDVKSILAEIVAERLQPVARPLVINADAKPHVILMVGVNGAGKTTTIGKLAQQFRNEGKTTMFAAGDTFRAAAVEQLKVWGTRTGSEVISRDIGADAAGLAFDAAEQAKQAGTDVLLIDTAGRLQNRTELMDELAKIVRVLKKQDEAAPHSVILVLDASTGQNALNQAQVFTEIAGVTGLVMTKLDGTARGGILVALASKFSLPIHAIGVGEGIEDLQPFAPEEFAEALVGGGIMGPEERDTGTRI